MIRILEDFHLHIDKESVFRQIHCFPDSPVYEEMEETFYEILPTVEKLCQPKGIVCLGTIPESFVQAQEAIFLLATVGQEVSDLSTEKFAQGEYVEGMLVDAMADAALFSLEADIERELKKVCSRWKRGITRRLEAPHDIPMEIQKVAFEQTKAAEYLGMELSTGYMFRPLKTSCNVYLTTEDMSVFRSQHNCRKCPNVTCGLRNMEPLKVTVVSREQGSTQEFDIKEETILELLCNSMEDVVAPCGGKGKCGKCKIQILEGELAVTEEDKAFFTKEELDSGWRLACKAKPMEEVKILLGWESEREMDVMSEFTEAKAVNAEQKMTRTGEVGFAIDIGTTTLAIQLVSVDNGEVLDTWTGLNPQRVYGADVISRIQAAMDGKQEAMTEMIRKALWKGMKELLERCKVDPARVETIVVAGNTTMLHLLYGYPCDGLGQMPFVPYSLKKECRKASDLFPEFNENIQVYSYPGCSAFVGADIVSGIYGIQMQEQEDISLLIDLGTNGEMALGNREGLLVTSTAAGPAFEGGNILWGTGSIPGAICKAKLEEDTLFIETIQNKPAVGICGTGVLELVAEFVEHDVIDETGRLEDEWFEEGYPVASTEKEEKIVLTQKDIREIQLAKAAIRGGIEALLHQYGIHAEQISHIYVAGGFGYHMDFEKAIRIGMFPEEFRGKMKSVGNSALYGAKCALADRSYLDHAVVFVERAKEVSLSADLVFQEAYMEGMLFESK